jgi:hypothetical protein
MVGDLVRMYRPENDPAGFREAKIMSPNEYILKDKDLAQAIGFRIRVWRKEIGFNQSKRGRQVDRDGASSTCEHRGRSFFSEHGSVDPDLSRYGNYAKSNPGLGGGQVSDEQEESWAICELMGHRVCAGRLSEEERFGGKVGRVDVPDDKDGFVTVFFTPQSLYRLTVVTEEVARAKARDHRVAPVYTYKVPEGEQLERPARAITARSSQPEEEDDDELPFDRPTREDFL